MSTKVTIEIPLDGRGDGYPTRLSDVKIGELVEWDNADHAQFYGGNPLVLLRTYDEFVSIKAPGNTWGNPRGMTTHLCRKLPPGTKITWEVEMPIVEDEED